MKSAMWSSGLPMTLTASGQLRAPRHSSRILIGCVNSKGMCLKFGVQPCTRTSCVGHPAPHVSRRHRRPAKRARARTVVQSSTRSTPRRREGSESAPKLVRHPPRTLQTWSQSPGVIQVRRHAERPAGLGRFMMPAAADRRRHYITLEFFKVA